MEIREEVIIINIDFECICKKGYLRPTGKQTATNPAIFLHKCTHCDYIENFSGVQYPYIVYEPKSQK